MAPTSDERREVAEALRGLRHRTYYSEEVVENIKDAIGIADPVNTFREPEDVYELLADLIDPTCENKYRNHGDRSFLCSRCGYEAWTYDDSFCDPDEFGFCPNCGARVVNNQHGPRRNRESGGRR